MRHRVVAGHRCRIVLHKRSMIKRILLTALCLVAWSNLQVMAQGYTALWKQVSEAQDKDLPQTEIEVLGKIAEKAQAEHSYGQLLKAKLRQAAVQTQISPDSADIELDRVKADLAKAEQSGNRVLAAVYQSVLGRIYKDKANGNGYRFGADDPNKAEYKSLSADYYAKSMEPIELLAKQSAKGYEPALIEGADSHIFGGDLLHVLGMEAEDYRTLHDWYLSHGNRRAACICAYYQTQKDRFADVNEVRKSKYLQTIDSLINVYQDLKECGELAIERYNFMDQAEDATAEEKMNYINYALQHWGAWPRMNILRNAQNQLTLPSFSVSIGEGIQLPNTKRRVEVRQLVNCQRLTMTVSRVNIKGDSDLDPNNDQDYAKLKKLIVNDGTQQTVTRRYVGQPDYKVLQDSMTIEGLPVGVYLVEFSTERANMRTERVLLHVSDLYVMHESLPDNRIRLVAVNATTGRPVPGAQIRLTTNTYNRNNGKQVNTLTTDGRGEAEYKWTNERRPNQIYVYTDKDDACPEQWFGGGFSFYDNKTTQNVYNVLTDRSLYRPGQTVHAAVIAYQNLAHRDTKVNSNEKLTLTLRNANQEVVEEKQVTTDEYGKTSADFVLPTTGLTGQFSISTKNSSTYFSVEEYKRPTFQVEFDEVTEKYQDGDTVTVVGHVKSFAGVPVQGARVKYNVVRRRALWWWRNGNEADKMLVTDTLTTDDEGCFEVKVPMMMPESRSQGSWGRFYNFIVEADATDAAGESHHGEMSLPLSDKATAFSMSMPSNIEVDSVARVKFSYLNNAGKPIPGDVIYRIFKGSKESKELKETQSTPANEPFDMKVSHLKSGLYTLEGICGEDTVTHEFVVFSLKDKRPAVETHDWFYASAKEFPTNGRPVYVQMGSSDKDQHIVYTLISGKKVLESGVIDQSNAITTRQFTYKEEYGDGVLFTCAWVREGRLYSHSISLSKPLPDKRLQLSWKTFRDRLTPGQKEEWTLHVDKVTKEQGDKVTNGASVLAVLFDKSLDDIRQHSWPFSLGLWRNLPNTIWQGRQLNDLSLYGELPYKSLTERALQFTHFDDEMFNFSPRVVFNHSIRVRGSRPMLMAKSASVNTMAVEEMATADALPEAPIGALDVKGEDEALVGSIAGLAKGDAGEGGKAAESTQMRENLNETAFFYPQLVTDENGDITMKFTLPESITTWRFMALATDKEVRYGKLESEVVAKKDVMIQPNVPRFMRQGDKGQLSARIFNTGEKAVKGTALIELLDPETEKVVYSQNKPFSLEAGKTASISFDVDATESKFAHLPLLVCRVSASGNGFSDGEQHYLPILPNRELVINTVPFTQNGPGTKTIDLSTLTGKGQTALTVEYTNHPAWLMIQTLPTVAKTSENNAISQAAAFYANSLAAHLLHLSPRIKSTIEQWKREQGTETSLMSSLEKNQELKTMVLDETPWVADARNESEQKRLLSDYFDENGVNYRLENNLAQLRKLQNSDGSWSWWPGMPGSLYMTVAVSKMMVRLTAMTGDNKSQAADMLSNAYSFMGRQIIKEVEEMKKQEKKGAKNVRPSETAIDWLYLTTIDGRKLSTEVSAAKTYLVNRLSKQTKEFTIYGKAYSAIILGQNGYEQKAKEYLQSIREYTVYKEEMGRYFDTRKAYYSWFDYKIPTEVAAIEAIRLLQPADTKTVEEMQRWLLQSKRTQNWDTPLNAVDAVYAFMKDNTETFGNQGDPTILKVDGKQLETSAATAGLGYVKSSQEGTGFKTFTAEKTSQGTSWGAVYARSFQPLTEIADAQSGLKVKREVIVKGGQGGQDIVLNAQVSTPNSLKVGDRIRIRITIEAERDYDFVQVSDKRAACLEPVGQLSGYHWGYYCAPRDNVTNYYFDRLAKGTHIVETEYYVDRTGTYQTGTCTVQCAYSPEYTARAAAKQFTITE